MLSKELFKLLKASNTLFGSIVYGDFVTKFIEPSLFKDEIEDDIDELKIWVNDDRYAEILIEKIGIDGTYEKDLIMNNIYHSKVLLNNREIDLEITISGNFFDEHPYYKDGKINYGKGCKWLLIAGNRRNTECGKQIKRNSYCSPHYKKFISEN